MAGEGSRNNGFVVEAHGAEKGWLGGYKLSIPSAESGATCFVCTPGFDKGWVVRLAKPEELDSKCHAAPGHMVIKVRQGPHQLSMSFSPVGKDRAGHDVDLTLTGEWKVAAPETFLRMFGLAHVSPGAPLSAGYCESWMIQQADHNVRDAVQDKLAQHGTWEALRDRNVLPPAWWGTQLSAWLGASGLTAAVVDRPKWSSADEERARVEQQRCESLARVEKENERRREAQLKEAQAEAAAQKEIRRIQTDASITEAEREHQLRLAEEQRQIEHIKACKEKADVERDAELAAAQHENNMAKVKQDRADWERKLVEVERRHEAALAALSKAEETLAKFASIGEQLVGALATKDKAQPALHQLSQEWGLKTEELDNLGYEVAPQAFLEKVRAKGSTDGEPVVIRKSNLQARSIQDIRWEGVTTRDIGPKRIQGLPVNSSLQFEFTTKVAGYVTFLNVGTSGRVWLHVPNPYVSPHDAKVHAGRPYQLPGKELLPWEQLRQYDLDYVEVGPPGWEHIVAIVSEKPLIPDSLVRRASPREPFVLVSHDELEALYGRLVTGEMGRWSGGVLSFLVQ
jgi:hypothetical protein